MKLNEKMYKARSAALNNRGWPSYKGLGITAKWTPVYIDWRLHMREIERLRLKIF